MNRPLLITIGIVTLLFLVGLWVYLLAYGAPEKPREVFANLGILSHDTAEEVRTIDTEAQEENQDQEVQLSLSGSLLEQLTTRAVAGFAFTARDRNTVRYVERGTGHIFEIDLTSGTETRLSVTTIPQTAAALFSPDAEVVAITTYTGYLHTTVVGTFAQESTLDLIKLPNDARNIAFADDETLYFTLSEKGKTVGYSFDIGTLKRTALFTLPFADALIDWASSPTQSIAYTKPTKYLEGYAYGISAGSTLNPIATGAYGLSILANGTYTIRTFIQDGQYVSQALQDGRELYQTIAMLDAKCAFSTIDAAQVWCASPLTRQNDTYVEAWQKGTMNSEDYLWVVDLEEQNSTLIGDLPALSGRTIDVFGLSLNENEQLLLFSNKIDGTLWLYRIAQE